MTNLQMTEETQRRAEELKSAMYVNLGLARSGRNELEVARTLHQILGTLVREVYDLSTSNPDGAYEKDSSYKIALCDVRLMLGEISMHLMKELDQDRPRPIKETEGAVAALDRLYLENDDGLRRLANE